MNSEPTDAAGEALPPPHQRRVRYAGKNPRHFSQKYKELDPERYPEIVKKVADAGKTPAGTHVPVLIREVMDALRLQAGMHGVDCTLGYGGHAREILSRITPNGKLTGLDIDPLELPKTVARLREQGFAEEVFQAVHSNYAGITKVLAQQSLGLVDFVFADLGCSSMQIDDPRRGFTFKREGQLDMRMNPTRGIAAADWLKKVSAAHLAEVLRENADEPHAERIADHLAGKFFPTTAALARAVMENTHDESGDSTRRVFQAIRIAVNEEFTALEAFLRSAPFALQAGGIIVILSFHSGEDRRVKKSFQAGLRDGTYSAVAEQVITAGAEERRANPRSIPAKLRWAQRG